MKILLSLFILIVSAQSGFIEEFSRNPKVVVIYGDDATEKEKDVAKYIYKVLELDQTGDLYDHIIRDSYALKHKYFYAKFHLIIVGSPKTNKLFSPAADIQTWDPSRKAKPTALQKDNQIQDGYNFAKYGHFKFSSGLGYLRHMINPFTLEAFNLTNGAAKLGPMTATYVTGVDTEGLKNAYIELLDNNMLEGVVVSNKPEQEITSRFQLGSEAFAYPADLNHKFYLEQEKYKLKFFGWTQGTLSDYSGVYKLSGIEASQICQLKFVTENPGLTTGDSHQNSILAIRFKNPDISLKALRGIDKNLKLALDIKDTPVLTVYRCSQVDVRWLLIRKGSWLMIENLPMSWKERLVKDADKLFR